MSNKAISNKALFPHLSSDDAIFFHDLHDDYHLLGPKHNVPVTQLPLTFLGHLLCDTPNNILAD